MKFDWAVKSDTGSITVMCGISGSGKSTWVKANGSKFIVICPDEFRKVLTGQDFYAPAEEMVWSCVKTATRVFAKQGKHVLIDATSTTISSRSQWIRIAKEVEVPVHCVWIQASLEDCKRRNSERTRQVPDDVIDRQFASFEPPTDAEGFALISVCQPQ